MRSVSPQSRRRLEIPDDGEFLWLMSLSDLMILLFVFFVVLFSFSVQKMDAADFEKASSVLKGISVAPKTPLDSVQEKLFQSLKENKLLEAVEISQKDHALILQIKEKFLFDSGSFYLNEVSASLVKLISNAIRTIPPSYHLGVEGHTDDVPIHQGGISDNWELSAKRAHSVLEALQLDDALRKRALIMGYGEMEPLMPNRDESGKAIPANQSRNRRVTLRIF